MIATDSDGGESSQSFTIVNPASISIRVMAWLSGAKDAANNGLLDEARMQNQWPGDDYDRQSSL